MEPPVPDQPQHDIRFGQRLLRAAELYTGRGQWGGQGVDVGLDGEHAADPMLGQVQRDFDGGAFAQVVDVGFVGQTETGKGGIVDAFGLGARLGDDQIGLGGIDLAS